MYLCIDVFISLVKLFKAGDTLSRFERIRFVASDAIGLKVSFENLKFLILNWKLDTSGKPDFRTSGSFYSFAQHLRNTKYKMATSDFEENIVVENDDMPEVPWGGQVDYLIELFAAQ